ncbi:hypothetical protein CPB84DRAFT_1874121 [Gymnopilus junonius]|uniref:Uncharacterized protein n=1 Tax=Gymnopilus junonius TaxID=109634 RepID=A0A9P5TSE4_GYMJU|nr:hypothetical protein CPB84DRAFT_1874121 [Gymnopilus junonius]
MSHTPGYDASMDEAVAVLEEVYGPFKDLTIEQALSWEPPPASAGHRGRYLWTDAFGVVDFITLFRITTSTLYLHLAVRLIDAVHDTLGRTRSQDSYLPGASAEHPLAGGLRIGKEEEWGPDGDGQYHHYLTLWMFALNRMSIATDDPMYNKLAIELAKAIHPAFMTARDSPRPRMFWKVSMDLSHPLVSSEGNLDPIDGYVIFNLLQEYSPDPDILRQEISEYKKILDVKWKYYQSDDPLDLGMTLWTAHWFAGKADWANHLIRKARQTFDRYFDHPISQRLAFREFGTCMGLGCTSDLQVIQDYNLPSLRSRIIRQWEKAGIGSRGIDSQLSAVIRRTVQRQGLKPITMVMYAAALLPGAFRKGYLGEA